MPEGHNYTDEDACKIVGMRLRNHRRPTPWRAIVKEVDPSLTETAVERYYWGVITGYGGSATGKRKTPPERPRHARTYRAGWPWYPREDDALHRGLAEAGQERNPPVDIAYMAAILARTEAEVSNRWNIIKNGGFDRGEGFFG